MAANSTFSATAAQVVNYRRAKITNLRMAQSPEESRTTAVGRKRKQVGEVWLANDALEAAEKRQKLEANDDYVPLDGSGASRRGSKESGEISTSDESAGLVFDVRRRPSKESSGNTSGGGISLRPRKAAAPVVNPKVTPMSDDPGIGRVPPGPSEMTLDDVEPVAFRKYVDVDAQKDPTCTIEEIVRKYSEPGMPHRKAAATMLHDWNGETKASLLSKRREPQGGATAAGSNEYGVDPTAVPGQSGWVGHITQLQRLCKHPKNFTRQMKLGDVPPGKLRMHVRGLRHTKPGTTWLDLVLLSAKNKQQSDTALQCLDAFARQCYIRNIPANASATLVGDAQAVSEEMDDSEIEQQDGDNGTEMEVYNGESDEEEASVGNTRGDQRNDYGELARNAASAPVNASPVPITNVRLYEISEEDQRLQHRYFGLVDPASYVRCLSCGEEGHMGDDCPANTCRHCGAVDEHFSGACPSGRKCGRCRRRGHDARTCTHRSVEGGGFGDVCDVCGNTGHVEEECSGLWRSYRFNEADTIKVSSRAMRKACYNCGSGSHWGDDCSSLPSFLHNKRGNNGTWSAAYANQFVKVEARDERGHGSYGGNEGYGRQQAYQLTQFDDMRD